jgi:hypothetical protein
MSRKTIPVETLTAKVNSMLALSTCSPVERLAMADVLEAVLHDTGNYRGFGYLDAKFNESGKLVSGDDSRRRYY